MIISHKHRFIFIKTKKTAGTSIEIALSGICGPDDIITPISPKDEATRQALGYRGPQNHVLPSGEQFYNHIRAHVVRWAVGEQIWRDYYTFCFERNPWDKAISWYYWERQFHPNLSLDDFFASGHFTQVGGPGGYDLYSENDKVIVDRVCRYETLAEEMATLAQRWGFEAFPSLPRAKSEFRTDRRHYRDILTPQQRDQVARAFHREIQLFGYSF